MSVMYCPACRASASHLTLLTSMLTYFRCAECSHRWQVPTTGEKTLLSEAVVDAAEIDVLALVSIGDSAVRPG